MEEIDEEIKTTQIIISLLFFYLIMRCEQNKLLESVVMLNQSYLLFPFRMSKRGFGCVSSFGTAGSANGMSMWIRAFPT